MKPRDLVEFTRRTYARPASVEGWAEDALVDAGLTTAERDLLGRVPLDGGRAIVLGLGGGREAIPLAVKGFAVTGVDFVPALVRRAEENAARRGVRIEGLVQDISAFEVRGGEFDLAWMTAGTYSSIPTSRRRRETARRILRALRPGGFFVCDFLIDPEAGSSPFGERLRRAFAWLTLGNVGYETGDRLTSGIEFSHAFRSESEIRAEFESAGFAVLHSSFPSAARRGGAVLKKAD